MIRRQPYSNIKLDETQVSITRIAFKPKIMPLATTAGKRLTSTQSIIP
jgi:hypothetical protein